MIKQDLEWIYYGAGMVYKMNRCYEAATVEFNRILTSNSVYANAYVQLAILSKIKGDKEKAKSFYDKAISLDPENEEANFQLGLADLEDRNLSSAEDRFCAVLNSKPTHTDAKINLAMLYGHKGNFEPAVALIEEAYEQSNWVRDEFVRLGWIKADDKDWSGAFELADRDRLVDRLSPAGQINLAQLYGRQGDFDRAIQLIDQAYTQNGELVDGYARLGWIKHDLQDWKGAFEIMNRDLEANRISPVWQINLAQMHSRLGDNISAERLIEQAYIRNETLQDGFARIGWIKTESQEWQAASELMRKEYENGRLSAKWKIKLAMVHIFLDECKDASNLIEDLYSRSKTAIDGYAYLGWAHYLVSRNGDILHKFVEKDAALNRLSGEGKKIKAFAMYARDDHLAARKLIDSIYNENKNIRDGYSVLGWMCFEQGSFEEGIALMDKDYKGQRLSTVWQINYAYRLAEAGELEKAHSLYNEVSDKLIWQEFRIGYQLYPLKIITKSEFEIMVRPAG
jgi:tetratricopeptide (TPR) repeat protein